MTSESPFIKCHKGSYFESILTNESFGRSLARAKDKKFLISDASLLFPIKTEGENVVLQSIKGSNLNNHIGVSTLAITKDKHFLIGIQNKLPLHSNRKLVPPGSGSCDYKDFKKCRKLDNNFFETIKYGMQRELKEECNLEKDRNAIETKLLGYYRIVARGGKPEFAGITKILEIDDEFEPNEELENLKKDPYNSVDDILLIINKYSANPDSSLPLLVNLFFLKRYININISNQKELNWLFEN
jgi:hypothetical protein